MITAEKLQKDWKVNKLFCLFTENPEDQQQCLCCYLAISKEDHFFIDTFEISVNFELTRGLLSCWQKGAKGKVCLIQKDLEKAFVVFKTKFGVL